MNTGIMKEYKESLKEYYSLLPPDWTWKHDQMTKNEAKENFDSFVSAIPNRISILERVVGANPPKVGFVADFSRESLEKLALWTKENTTVTYKTEAFIAAEQSNYAKVMGEVLAKKGIPNASPGTHVPNWLLSLESESLGQDIGIYFSEVLRKEVGGRYVWGYRKKWPKSFGFQEPVLFGEEENPIAGPKVGIQFMFRLIQGRADENWLAERFDLLKVGYPQ
jgi:hypothetical protein